MSGKQYIKRIITWYMQETQELVSVRVLLKMYFAAEEVSAFKN